MTESQHEFENRSSSMSKKKKKEIIEKKNRNLGSMLDSSTDRYVYALTFERMENEKITQNLKQPRDHQAHLIGNKFFICAHIEYSVAQWVANGDFWFIADSFPPFLC